MIKVSHVSRIRVQALITTFSLFNMTVLPRHLIQKRSRFHTQGSSISSCQLLSYSVTHLHLIDLSRHQPTWNDPTTITVGFIGCHHLDWRTGVMRLQPCPPYFPSRNYSRSLLHTTSNGVQSMLWLSRKNHLPNQRIHPIVLDSGGNWV